mmetsp:Transcript_36440/g.60366  ORF Transcript_36440/g.60366 Transcript_36440/m.60366 type:complete len:334 (+) Transcript_36440:92-1093(+)
MAEGHRDKRVKPGYVLNPFDEPLLRKCDGFMKTILKRNQAVHFAKPVDWKKMGLHDYPKLIKQPMDLSTVSDRLARNFYVRLEDWANDMRLVWKNAFIFNAPDSMYFKAAKVLSDLFEKKLEEFEREAESVNQPQLDTMERCNLVLADMSRNPLAEWFREPVDHVSLGLTDYTKVVSQPMDLGTVQKKLERGQYLSPDDFAGDVRLVWQNAITYNSASSMFGVVASILAQTFDRRFALITRSASLDPGRPIPDRPGWPTFQQKKKFYDLCTKLTLADLNQMVGLVQRTCPGGVQQCGQKEVEVDVDELDMDTFNKVMQWVSSKTHSKPVKNES